MTDQMLSSLQGALCFTVVAVYIKIKRLSPIPILLLTLRIPLAALASIYVFLWANRTVAIAGSAALS